MVGVEHAQQGGACLQLGQFFLHGAAHLGHQLGAEGTGRVHHLCAGFLVGCIGDVGGHTGLTFNQHFVARLDQLLDGLWRGSHPGFAWTSLFRDPDSHGQILSWGVSGVSGSCHLPAGWLHVRRQG